MLKGCEGRTPASLGLHFLPLPKAKEKLQNCIYVCTWE